MKCIVTMSSRVGSENLQIARSAYAVSFRLSLIGCVFWHSYPSEITNFQEPDFIISSVTSSIILLPRLSVRLWKDPPVTFSGAGRHCASVAVTLVKL